MASSTSDTVAAVQQSVLDPSVIRASGAGKAYQSVAQSSAIAVQDAADYLRNISTISTTAIGVAMAQYLATQDPAYLKVIQEAQKIVAVAAKDFGTIGQQAAQVVDNFPSS